MATLPWSCRRHVIRVVEPHARPEFPIDLIRADFHASTTRKTDQDVGATSAPEISPVYRRHALKVISVGPSKSSVMVCLHCHGMTVGWYAPPALIFIRPWARHTRGGRRTCRDRDVEGCMNEDREHCSHRRRVWTILPCDAIPALEALLATALPFFVSARAQCTAKPDFRLDRLNASSIG